MILISRKKTKIKELEKRIADLEVQIQSQQKEKVTKVVKSIICDCRICENNVDGLCSPFTMITTDPNETFHRKRCSARRVTMKSILICFGKMFKQNSN